MFKNPKNVTSERLPGKNVQAQVYRGPIFGSFCFIYGTIFI